MLPSDSLVSVKFSNHRGVYNSHRNSMPRTTCIVHVLGVISSMGEAEWMLYKRQPQPNGENGQNAMAAVVHGDSLHPAIYRDILRDVLSRHLLSLLMRRGRIIISLLRWMSLLSRWWIIFSNNKS